MDGSDPARPVAGRAEGLHQRDDLKIICQKLDFYGFNVLSPELQRSSSGETAPLPRHAEDSLAWPITPEVILAARFHYERYGLPILVTENGMANTDFVME